MSIPQEGTGEKINEINDLNEYLLEYSPVMLDKVTKLDEPLHQPMKEQALSHFDTYQRPLFPVQAHVATGATKALQVQKGIIIQGNVERQKRNYDSDSRWIFPFNRTKGISYLRLCATNSN